MFGIERDEELHILVAREFGEAELEFVSCYDGDTFTANIKGHHPIIGESIAIRIDGIDCPEMKDPRRRIKELAYAAKFATREYLVNAKKIEIRRMRRDKYFRILGEVYVDGQNVADLLLARGLAKHYDGGTKSPW